VPANGRHLPLTARAGNRPEPPQLRIRQALINTVATGCYEALTLATGLIGDASRGACR